VITRVDIRKSLLSNGVKTIQQKHFGSKRGRRVPVEKRDSGCLMKRVHNEAPTRKGAGRGVLGKSRSVRGVRRISKNARGSGTEGTISAQHWGVGFISWGGLGGGGAGRGENVGACVCLGGEILRGINGGAFHIVVVVSRNVGENHPFG